MLDEKRVTGNHLRPYLRNTDVQWDSVNVHDLPMMDFDAADRERYLLQKGDLLVCEGGEIGRAAIWSGELSECYYQKALHRLRPLDLASEHPRFMYYALLAAVGSDAYVNGGKSTIAHLPADQFRRIRLPRPPYREQERIASFLDQKTARIDALIAEKQRLAIRVSEYADAQTSALLCGRQSLKREYRRTGWRYLDRIPSEWSLCHLRWIARRVDVGIAEAATHAYADEGVPILRSTNIRPNSIEGDLIYIEPWFAERNGSKTLFEHDLVTVRTGYPGVTARVPKVLHGCQCFTMLITTLMDSCLPEFYERYLNSAPARAYFEVESWGSAQRNISVPILKEIMVPRLPVKEQGELVRACQQVESATAQLLGHISKHVNHLREFRASLISASVSGRLAVSG